MNTTSKPLPTFQGFKDLTTKILEQLKGKASVSKQFVEDLANMPELKQAERTLIRNVLGTVEGDTIAVKDFANKVKTELLPLKRSTTPMTRYENIGLPESDKGPIADYSEHIYQSPIKTSAKDVHFSHFDSSFDGYFAHTRIEDIPAPNTERYLGDIAAGKKNLVRGKLGNENAGDTRRVIELQSDLFQKGNLEREVPTKETTYSSGFGGQTYENTPGPNAKAYADQRATEVAKLEPYRNTWQERIIREEVKQAAKDGKTKLQFPTGETAMKIEGLVNRSDKWVTLDNKVVDGTNIKDGDLITYQTHEGTPHEDRRFLITKNYGDGTFDAVDSLTAENDHTLYDLLDKKGLLDDGRMPTIEELQGTGATEDKQIAAQLSKLSEKLSAQNTVDTNNPIYKFYEKEVGRYLTNKYGAKVVTDPQGVKWYEIEIPTGMARFPVEAFGIIPLLPLNNEQ